jgi:hypothetical protein
MSMAPTTDQPSQRIDLGQRFLLLAIFATLAVEVVVTVVNAGQWFSWVSLALGIVAGVGILYLGNWLYTGNKTALAVTRLWVMVMLILAVFAVTMKLTDAPGEAAITRHLGVNILWEGWLKLAVYAGFAAGLFVPGYVLDFLGHQRGEAPAAPATAVAAAPAGEPAELTAEHTTALSGLGSAMNSASLALLLVGVLDVIAAVVLLGRGDSTGGLLSLFEGIALVGLGGALVAPTKAVQALAETTPRNMGLVTRMLTQLLATGKAYLILFTVLAFVVVLRIALHAL